MEVSITDFGGFGVAPFGRSPHSAASSRPHFAINGYFSGRAIRSKSKSASFVVLRVIAALHSKFVTIHAEAIR